MKQNSNRQAHLVNLATDDIFSISVFDSTPKAVLARLAKRANLSSLDYMGCNLSGFEGDWVFICKGYKPDKEFAEIYKAKLERAKEILK